MNRPVNPYIAFSLLIIVALIVGAMIWSDNKQLAPNIFISPSPQTSIVTSSPAPTSATTKWMHYTNKEIGFQIDIPTSAEHDRCKTLIPLKFSDKNGHVTIFSDYSFDAKCLKTPVPAGNVYANVWVSKVDNFAQAQQFFQKVNGNPTCKLSQEEWIAQEQKGQLIYRLDGNRCSYNGVVYFKNAGIVTHHDLPIKTSPTFGADYDNKFVNSIKPLTE